MSKNLIPIIAKELGVAIGEEFKVDDCNYRFTETRLEYKHSDGYYAPAILPFNHLNEKEIIKLPFEPECGEKYWTYDCDCEVVKNTWFDDFEDFKNKKLGIVFRTKEDAIAARPARYKELTGKDWKG